MDWPEHRQAQGPTQSDGTVSLRAAHEETAFIERATPVEEGARHESDLQQMARLDPPRKGNAP